MSGQVPHIVTDSTADIPAELARSLDITVIPCQIHTVGQTFREGVDITRRELAQRLRNLERVTTSQPPVGVFAETYRRLLADGRPIISIHLASQLSGLFSTAFMAANEVDQERITLVDGRQASMCTGWLAIGAAEAAQAGQTKDEVLRRVHDMMPRLRLFALIDDLRHLQRGGRVSWASGLLGSLFSIKPILLVKDGRADAIEKVRSLNRGIERLVALAAALGPLERVAVLHVDAPELVAQLVEETARVFPRERMVVGEAGSVVGAHAGPGTVGIACLMAG